MGVREVLINLNELKTLRVIQDYAIGGGYACIYYGVPMASYDLDVMVLLPSEDDYHRLYEHYREQGNKIENVYIYIENMPVQFLPNYILPLFNSAIKEANTIEFEDINCKFVSVEYLIILLLTAFRGKDKIRIKSLLSMADKDLLSNIIKRFDNDKGSLYKRYREVLAGTC